LRLLASARAKKYLNRHSHEQRWRRQFDLCSLRVIIISIIEYIRHRCRSAPVSLCAHRCPTGLSVFPHSLLSLPSPQWFCELGASSVFDYLRDNHGRLWLVLVARLAHAGAGEEEIFPTALWVTQGLDQEFY
jgi:hypothetical protein